MEKAKVPWWRMDNATDVRATRPEQKNSAELKRHLIAGGVFYFRQP